MRTITYTLCVITMLLAGSVLLPAAVLDFESFNDGDLLTNQIPGVTFTNTVVLSSDSSLPAAAPPHSGTNVGVDLGPIEITFTAPITSFSGFFTYTNPLTITAYDASNTVLDMAISAFNSNFIGGDPGSSPNELLSLAAPGIVRVTLAATANGSSFTMDDIEVLTNGTAVPEPSTAAFAAIGLAGTVLIRRWRSARS